MAVEFEKVVTSIVSPLVMNPNDIAVKCFPDEQGTIIIQLLVNNDDLGRVIGKGGKIAGAIRTILYASASKEGQRVHLEIDSFK